MRQLKKYLDYIMYFIEIAILFGLIFMPISCYISMIDNSTLIQTSFIPLHGIYKQYQYDLRGLYIVGIVCYFISFFFRNKLSIVGLIIRIIVLVSSISIISFLFFDESYLHLDVLPSMLTFYIITICLLVAILITNVSYFIYKRKQLEY